MRLNPLKTHINKWLNHEKKLHPAIVATPAPVGQNDPQPPPPKFHFSPNEKVVGGVVLWQPIDRTAARVICKAPWWAQPLPAPKPVAVAAPLTPPKALPNKKRKHVKPEIKRMSDSDGHIPTQDFVSPAGVRWVKAGNGDWMCREEELDKLIAMQIDKLPAETRPMVQTAKDARAIVNELMEGLGGDMEKCQASLKIHLEDIRQTRFAVVTETAFITNQLKEIRQFFLGSDYKEQVARLKEFVDLCERLQKLKETGFLDSVADTMLRLACDRDSGPSSAS